MQVLLAIPFRVSFFNRVIIEKAFSQITNMENIFSANLLSGAFVRLPSPPDCGPGYP